MSYTYLDDAATTRVDPRVKEKINTFFTEKYGNPSSLHSMGREASAGVKEARRQTAELIGADKDEIIFTSGGTESDNLAIKGCVEEGDHIITTKIEHPAVYNTCRYLEGEGCEVTYLPVNGDGTVDKGDLKSAIKDETVLASVMYANNEIGTIQPISDLAEIAHENDILFHTDAVQAVGKVPIDVKKEMIDLLSLSGHKYHGPKGVGALYIANDVEMDPILHGGGHEMNYRSGTENVPGIVGLGEASRIAREDMDENVKKMKELRDKLIDGILSNIEESYLNGHREKRLPNNANFYFKAVEGEALVLHLDSRGIGASTGSACSSTELEASRVLLALGLKEENAHGSLRLTLGKYNSEEDIDKALEAIPEVVEKLREMSPLWEG